MITRGVVYRVMLEDVKKEGKRVSRHYFNYITAAEFLQRLAGKFYARKKGDSTSRKYAQNTQGTLFKDIHSFAFVFLASLIPLAGDCTLAWQFAYPGRTFAESICDSIEAVKKNWLRMLLMLIFDILVICIFVFLISLAISIALILIANSSEGVERVLETITAPVAAVADFASYGDYAMIGFFCVLGVGIALPFIRSSLRVRTLRVFFKGVDKHPPTGTLYRKYGTALEKIREKRGHTDD